MSYSLALLSSIVELVGALVISRKRAFACKKSIAIVQLCSLLSSYVSVNDGT